MIRQEYKEQLQQTRGGWNEWGSSAVRNCGPEIARWAGRHKPRTILDFGCGAGTLRPYLQDSLPYDAEIVEYDPSVPGKDTVPTQVFDAIITTDVLEHIEPVSLDDTLGWIREHSLRQYHHIDCNETKDRLPDGRDVHLIVQEPEWWEQQLVVPGWLLMERHVHDKRKKSRFPRRSCTFVLERQG